MVSPALLALDFPHPNHARILRGRLVHYDHRRIDAPVVWSECGEPNDAPEPPNWVVWQHETFRGGHVIVHVRTTKVARSCFIKSWFSFGLYKAFPHFRISCS